MKRLLFFIMAFIPLCNLTIGNYQLKAATHIEIISDTEQIADEAKIALPLRVQNEAKQIAGAIKEGDKVAIQLGFEGYAMNEEFTGYVKRIQASEELVLLCEDESYQLHRTQVAKIFQQTTLTEIVQFVASQANIQVVGVVPTVNFEKFIIHPSTAYHTLKTLRDEYRFTAYMSGSKLFVGTALGNQGKVVKYHTHKNVEQLDLQFEQEEGRLYEVEAIGITEDNQEIRVMVGTKGGARRTLHYTNIEDEASLKLIAQEDLDQLGASGLSGSFLAWGLPYIQLGDLIDFTDPGYTELSGKYLTQKIVTTWGKDGFHRRVTPGRSV